MSPGLIPTTESGKGRICDCGQSLVVGGYDARKAIVDCCWRDDFPNTSMVSMQMHSCFLLPCQNRGKH